MPEVQTNSTFVLVGSLFVIEKTSLLKSLKNVIIGAGSETPFSNFFQFQEYVCFHFSSISLDKYFSEYCV
jgi:hypothetical protein